MKNEKIRYAVVGLGHIAQTAMIPAFKNARKNSELVALVSDDPKKLKVLGKKYKIKNLFDYASYERLLKSGLIDAVYIATPNTHHRIFAEPAIRNGIHVLCEKPITSNVTDAMAMHDMLSESHVKMMVAYRLHFDAANLEAVKIAQSGKLGKLRIFNSVFTMQVKDKNNIRLRKETGGGPLFDIGIYCINAARYLFASEPYEVFASGVEGTDERFAEVDEMTSVIMKFPEDRVANFICSFGASDNSVFDLIGSKGTLRLENAYDYAMPMKLTVNKDARTTTKRFKKHDQFAAELLYFSNCVLNNKIPEPGIREGLIDVDIIQALLRSRESGRAVTLRTEQKQDRPTAEQKISRPGINPPEPVHVTSPSGENS